MRVLMLTPRLPYPPHRGDTLRSWQMLLALARRHTVYLASAESAAPDEHNLAQVKACCEDVAIAPRSNWQNALAGLASLARGQSLTSGYFARTALGPAIKAWQQTPFDAVLAFSGAMAPLALSIPAANTGSTWLMSIAPNGRNTPTNTGGCAVGYMPPSISAPCSKSSAG
jgi:hypothetical protein